MKREQRKTGTPWVYMVALTVLWALMAWFYRSADVLPLPPGHIHGWRQSDCASLTRNFYEENLPIWQPRVHFAKDDGSGKAVGEFPILNYGTAKLMKITGFSWSAQRAVVLFFTWLALMGLFLWLRTEFGNRNGVLICILPLLIFTSPIFVYYGCNYLPDVPSAALALCALAADAGFRRTEKRRYAVWAALLIALAVLVKISAGVVWVALLALLALRFWPLSSLRMAIKKWGGLLALHVALAVCVWGWYHYAHQYDFGRKPMIFLTHIRPYWETNPNEFAIVNKQIFEVWLPDYFHLSVWYTAALAFLANLWLTRKNKALFALNVLVPFGFFAFLVLMYKQLYFHDYYLVIPILAPVMVIGIFVVSVWNVLESRILKGVLWAAVAGLLGFNAAHAQETIIRRYFETEYGFVNYDLLELQPKLRQMGIPRTDLMIIVPDASPNNSLLLADQYGYSNFMETNGSEADVERHVHMGAKWLAVTDTTYLHNDFLRPFTTDTVTVYNEIHVFKLSAR